MSGDQWASLWHIKHNFSVNRGHIQVSSKVGSKCSTTVPIRSINTSDLSFAAVPVDAAFCHLVVLCFQRSTCDFSVGLKQPTLILRMKRAESPVWPGSCFHTWTAALHFSRIYWMWTVRIFDSQIGHQLVFNLHLNLWCHGGNGPEWMVPYEAEAQKEVRWVIFSSWYFLTQLNQTLTGI